MDDGAGEHQSRHAVARQEQRPVDVGILGALGGDSAAITGVTANYLCQDVQVTP